MKRAIVFVLVFSVFSVLSVVNLLAADWPQWRGLNRDAHSPETSLKKDWPTDGPKVVWTFKKAGVGYGPPSIVGDTVYVPGGDGTKGAEFVIALDLATGEQKWKTTIPTIQKDASFKTGWGGGPRGAPTINGDQLFFIGAQGDIACLETKDGKTVWHKSMTKDLGGKVMRIWGFSESPLVDGDNVICMPGYNGDDGVGTVQALDRKTGEVKWVCKDITDEAPYSSLVITEAGGVKQYIAYTGSGVHGIRATDGKLLWKEKMGGNDTGIIPTPIIHGDMVFISNGYNVGCGAVKLEPDGDGVKATKLYFNKNLMNHHGGVVRVGDYVFGSTGNTGGRKSMTFVCLDIKTGDVKWKEPKALEGSSVCVADGSIYCYGEASGTLVRIAPNPEGFKEEARFKIPETSEIREPRGGVWTHPVIAAGKLFLRDQDLLFCFDLTK